MGVGEDFSKFKDGYNITSELISSISARYKRITRQLNTDFWNTNSETAHSLYVGSYGRDTAAKGISDLDIAFELPNAEYHKYNAHQGNGQSALLQAVKKSMQNTYSSSDTSGDGQVVIISFTDGIKFEVLPVFANKEVESFTFPNSNGGGSWGVCNPRAEIAAIKKRNDATNHNMKYLGRMMRVWTQHCAVPMSGMLVDTLAYQFIEGYEHRDKSFLYHDYLARDYFDFLYKQDEKQTIWRAPGSGSHVHRTGVFEHKARSAYLIELNIAPRGFRRGACVILTCELPHTSDDRCGCCRDATLSGRSRDVVSHAIDASIPGPPLSAPTGECNERQRASA